MIRILLLFFLGVIILILFGVYLSEENTSVEKAFFSLPFISSQQKSQTQAVIAISPGTLELPGGQKGSLNIDLSSGNNQLKTVQIEIAFNPSLLHNVEILPGSFLQEPVIRIDEVDQERGRIRYVLSTAKESTQTSGTVATVSFTTPYLASGSAKEAKVFFLPKTSVYGFSDQPVSHDLHDGIVKIK